MTALQHSRDPESLLPAAAGRACPCRCLDWCLLAGLCALAAAFAGLVFYSNGGALPLPLSRPLGTPQPAAALPQAYKEAGAQMLPKSYLITNKLMEWESDPRVDGVVFSSNFNYDTASHKLGVKVGGLYFIYVQLAVRCTASTCRANQTVQVIVSHMDSGNNRRPILTVSLDLSSKSQDTVSRFSAALQPLQKGATLDVRMEVDKPGSEDWQLDQNTKKVNFFGLFRLPSSSEVAEQ
ncbi:tumor necrosis factor ligand superfamily member 9 [Carettochelys insculpta]|uniref:tumor necrosis factor ligand superfamily member 9 n=1 Tax=Carettochelys insculpta TaxID=44489 RepID=UPI003EBF8476